MNNLLSQREVAEQLEVTPRTIQRWVQTGYFPTPAYIGRRAVYDQQTVSQWVSKQLSTTE